MLNQLANSDYQIKALMRQSAQRELQKLAPGVGDPRPRGQTLGARAVAETKMRGAQDSASLDRFMDQNDRMAALERTLQQQRQLNDQITPEMKDALKRVRDLKPEYQGSNDEFFRSYLKHGPAVMNDVPTYTPSPTPTISQGMVPSTPKQYAGLVAQAAKQHGVPERLLSALIQQESGWNPKAKSPAGALGIAQFMPGTAKGFGIDPLDPNQAIPAAALYLKRSFEKFGSWDLALAAYNAGGGAVGKYGGIPPYPETQNYVRKIMGAATQP